MAWYSKEFANVEGTSAVERLQEACLSGLKTGTLPPDILIFSRHDLRTNSLTIYFSPAGEVLARSEGATPCERPSRDRRLALSFGDSRFVDTAFAAE